MAADCIAKCPASDWVSKSKVSNSSLTNLNACVTAVASWKLWVAAGSAPACLTSSVIVGVKSL